MDETMPAQEIEYLERPVTEDVSGLFRIVPELTPLANDVVTSRINGHGLLVLAILRGRPVGFKLGYGLSAGVFYSWIGGVAPAVRKLGVGRRLLRFQESLIRERGFASIRVKSMNKFPAMLHLLISEGYQIVDVDRERGKEPRIIFEKQLKHSA